MKKLVLWGALALAPILAYGQGYANYPAVVSSFAANCIPNAVTAATLVCGGLTDNGTNVISTEAILAPDGTASLPGYAFSSQANTGLFKSATSQLDLMLNATANARLATDKLTFPSGLAIIWTSGSVSGGVADTFFRRRAAANFNLGTADVNGSPVAQTISVQNAITGTDLPGAAAFTFAAPLGTGAGAGSSTQFQRALMGATGTTAQTGIAAFVVCESKTLSNTSATTTALANIALASNSGGGARGSITVVATDGTNFDSETQDFVVSYVNKATVGTVGTAAITASTAANNSGSATIGMTATFAGTTLSIKATPVFTTIVPTTVTSYIELQNHGAGAVTCQ